MVFDRDIQPILETHCYECHGAKKTKAKLRLDRRAAAMKGGETGVAIVPGDSEHSLMVRRLLGLDGDDRMPKDGDPVPAAQIALIRAWIDQGAEWPEAAGEVPSAASPAEPEEPEHWAYRRPVRPALPEIRTANWARNPIDRFILARLEKEGLKPSPEAALETLVRRVSLDLIGLPPSPQEMDEVRPTNSSTAGTRLTRDSSTGSSRRRTTASGGRGRGSTSRATPIRTGSRRTCRASCGSTATG